LSYCTRVVILLTWCPIAKVLYVKAY